RTSVLLEMPKPPYLEEASEAESTETTEAAPVENGPIPLPQPVSKVPLPKTGRLVLTQDQLINVMRGRMRQAAEAAVRESMEKEFEPALRQALAAVEETRQGSVVQVEEAATQQRNILLQATRSELLERLEERIDDVRVRWDAELNGYRMRAEEILDRVERHTASARRDLEEAKAVTERAIRDVEPLLSSQMEKTHLKAAEEFHLNAAQTPDRHL